MKSEKARELIDAVRGLTDQEAALLAVFLAGFRAGKQTAEEEAAAARRQGAAMPPV